MASTHKSLRSGTANKRPTTSIADGQIALNTNTTSPGLFFKDSTGATIIKVGPVHVGTTAPNASPAAGGSAGNSVGEIWLDTSLTPVGVKIWNGSAFVNATPVGSTTVQGLLELATNAETQTGTDPDRAVTPAGLQSKVSDSTSTTSSTTIASSTAVKSAYDLANAALPKSGGTVTGNLEIGTTGSLSFEGATADNFETTIAVVDPTADRTITLPDTTGTVVTTGDTGTVTGTMIADGTIVDGDISASAEIAVSKLADGTARQLLQTDAAGTGVEWASNIDVPGTLDVTSTATFDSIASHPLGSAAAPTLTFTGDTNTGIYSPGADQVAISTNGTGRLFVDASGNIGLGTSSFPYATGGRTCLDINGSSTSLINLKYGNVVGLTAETSSSAAAITAGGTTIPLVFYTNGSERLRITSAGLVGIGTSAPGASLTIVADSSSNGVDILGRSSDNASRIRFTNNAYNAVYGLITHTTTNLSINNVVAGALVLSSNNTERARIDSSGRLLVGTSTARANFYNSSNTATLQLEATAATVGFGRISSVYNDNTANAGSILLGKTRGTAVGDVTAVSNGDNIFSLSFQAADGTELVEAAAISAAVDGTPGANDMPGRLVFSTTADGASIPTERLRITSAGLVGIGTSSPVAPLHVVSGSGLIRNAVNDGTSAGTAIYALNSFNGAYDMAQLTATQGASFINPVFKIRVSDTSKTLQDRLTINSSGQVGIGTATPSSLLSLGGAASAQKLLVYEDVANSRYGFGIQAGEMRTFAGSTGVLTFGHVSTGDATTYSEKARIDTSGRLLVGTSSSSDTNCLVAFQGNPASASNGAQVHLRRGEAASAITSGEGIGYLVFTDNTDKQFAYIGCEADATAGTNDYPGRLVFSTTADGASSPTEHVRINAAGGFKASTNGTYTGSSAAYHEFYQSNNDQSGLAIRCAGASFTDIGLSMAIDRNTTNNTYYFIRASVTGVAYRFNVADSGNCTNANNSYTGISDIKLKENIVDASLQWNDIKALQIRNYNFKEETGQPTHRQIGLIAQELELVCPNLVDESPDLDDEGNDLGTVTKSVNYSVLYMKAVKALQEAMERIETLEAKVAALESA